MRLYALQRSFATLSLLLPMTAFAAGVDQTSYVPIGGIEQWISIKGENRGTESWAATMNTQYDMALAKARQDHDAAAIKKLETDGKVRPVAIARGG